MSTITRPRAAVNAKSRQPLDARLTLAIRGTSYAVTPIPPGPDNTKAFRLEKLCGKGEVYDLARTNDGLVVCDCPSYVATHEGTCSTCKHGQALVMVGLLEAPKVEAAPQPLLNSTKAAPVPYAPHVAKLAAIAEAEDAVRREGEPPASSRPRHSAVRAFSPLDHFGLAEAAVKEGRAEWVPIAGEPAKGHDPIVTPAPELVPPLDRFDTNFYRAQNAVVEGRAMWLTSKPQPPEPEPASAPIYARDIVLIDDDGTPLETPAEMDRRHRDEQHAAHAVASGHAEWLEGRPAEGPCCPDDEPSPCSACLDADETTARHDVEDLVECPRCGGSGVREFFRPDGPELEECSSCSGTGEVDAATAETLRELMEEADREADRDDTDWDDDHVWNPTETVVEDPAPSPMPLAEWLDLQVSHHRRIGGAEHAWLADKLAALAGQARWLDATTSDAFDDRLSAMLDAAADAAESRAAACC